MILLTEGYSQVLLDLLLDTGRALDHILIKDTDIPHKDMHHLGTLLLAGILPLTVTLPLADTLLQMATLLKVGIPHLEILPLWDIHQPAIPPLVDIHQPAILLLADIHQLVIQVHQLHINQGCPATELNNHSSNPIQTNVLSFGIWTRLSLQLMCF